MGAPLKPKIRWRFEQIGKLLVQLAKEKHIDFITLQETYYQKMRDALIVKPWRDEFSYFHCTHEKGWRLGQSGLTTLSRWEIVEAEFKGYCRCCGVDCLVYKGVLHTRLKMEGGVELDLYNAHPQASYSSQKRPSRTRIAQFKQLIAFIQKTHKSGNPILLTGDLNCADYNVEYKMLVDGSLENHLKFIDIMRELFPDKGIHSLNTLIHKRPDQEKKIDHVLLLPGEGWQWIKGESSTEVLDLGYSDHRAVLSTITIRREKNA